jgi:hypothetical protein
MVVRSQYLPFNYNKRNQHLHMHHCMFLISESNRLLTGH